jgi:DNA-binding IclR family transcriptional regulator
MKREADVEAIIACHFIAQAAAARQPDEVASHDRKFIEAMARGIAILEAFEQRPGSLSNAELHQRTGFSKPAITRLTHTLMMLGYLRRANNGRFELTVRVGALARPFYEAAAARLPNDALNSLAASGPWCIVIAEPDAGALVITASYGSQQPGTPQCAHGTRLELASTSAGHAWSAAFGTQSRRNASPLLPSNLPSAEIIMKARAELAEKKFCFEAGGWRRGVATIAMPVAGDARARSGVAMCAAPDKPAVRERLCNELAPKLREVLS